MVKIFIRTSIIASYFIVLALALGAQTDELYFVDTHSQADSEQVLQRVITLMDQAGVRRTILSSRGKLRNLPSSTRTWSQKT